MVVNPARAGMIPSSETVSACVRGKPRASGDDPPDHGVGTLAVR